MSYSIDYKVISQLKFNQCRIQYPTLFNAFENLTVKQLTYLIPKKDRQIGNKAEMIYYLLSSLKRRYIQTYLSYKNPFDFLLEDKIKFNVSTIEFLENNEDKCTIEWVGFLTNKLF